MKLRLKPGALPRFQEYMAELERRRAECEESLVAEKAPLEAFFVDGEYAYVFKQVEDLAASRRYQKTSPLPIYDLVRRLDADCIESAEEFSSVITFQL